jgi:hypothetical protein
MILDRMTRTELEAEILAEDIHPTDAAGIARLSAMTTDELRELVRAWIWSFDESHVSCGGRGR